MRKGNGNDVDLFTLASYFYSNIKLLESFCFIIKGMRVCLFFIVLLTFINSDCGQYQGDANETPVKATVCLIEFNVYNIATTGNR